MHHFSAMKAYIFSAAFLTLTAATLFANTPGDTTTLQETVLLKRGTVITLELGQDLSSNDAEVGDLISLSVYDNVTAQGAVVLHSGLFGQARVTIVRKPGAFGRPGELEIEAINVETTDGQRILLSGVPLNAKGHSNKGAALGAGLIIPAVGVALGAPILLPFAAVGLLVKGKDGALVSHTHINAYVTEDVRIRR